MIDDKVLKRVKKDFKSSERDEVLSILSELKREHVMAKSYDNWFNTHMAILHLSKGDLDAVRHYTESAKSDFRDVIYWATQE